MCFFQENKAEVRYHDLMKNFEDALKSRAQIECLDASFPSTIGINAFRGFLDEFHKKKENKELPKVETKKERRRKAKDKDKEFVLVCS